MQWCKKYRTDLFPFSSLSLNVWLSHASFFFWKGISQLSFCSTPVNPKSSTLQFLYLLSMTRLRTLHDFAALPFLVLVHRCRVVLLREDREHGEKDKREGQGLFLPWKFQWIDSQKRRISSEIPVVWKLEDRSLPGKGAAGSAAMLESISCWEPAKISSCSHKIQMQSSTQQIYDYSDSDVKYINPKIWFLKKIPSCDKMAGAMGFSCFHIGGSNLDVHLLWCTHLSTAFQIVWSLRLQPKLTHLGRVGGQPSPHFFLCGKMKTRILWQLLLSHFRVACILSWGFVAPAEAQKYALLGLCQSTAAVLNWWNLKPVGFWSSKGWHFQL